MLLNGKSGGRAADDDDGKCASSFAAATSAAAAGTSAALSSRLNEEVTGSELLRGKCGENVRGSGGKGDSVSAFDGERELAEDVDESEAPEGEDGDAASRRKVEDSDAAEGADSALAIAPPKSVREADDTEAIMTGVDTVDD
jgi:hypothetical protein